MLERRSLWVEPTGEGGRDDYWSCWRGLGEVNLDYIELSLTGRSLGQIAGQSSILGSSILYAIWWIMLLSRTIVSYNEMNLSIPAKENGRARHQPRTVSQRSWRVCKRWFSSRLCIQVNVFKAQWINFAFLEYISFVGLAIFYLNNIKDIFLIRGPLCIIPAITGGILIFSAVWSLFIVYSFYLQERNSLRISLSMKPILTTLKWPHVILGKRPEVKAEAGAGLKSGWAQSPNTSTGILNFMKSTL
jgi:hypothetical protein